jgi:hypothetical protein
MAFPADPLASLCCFCWCDLRPELRDSCESLRGLKRIDAISKKPELEPETQTSNPYRNQSSTQQTELPELAAPNFQPRTRRKTRCPTKNKQTKTTRPTARLQNTKIGANPILNLNQTVVKKRLLL